MEAITKSIDFDRIGDIINLFGNFDVNIKLLETSFGVSISFKENQIKVSGAQKEVENTEKILRKLIKMVEAGETITEQNINYLKGLVEEDRTADIDEYMTDYVCVTSKGRPIKAKTVGQKKYIDTIKKAPDKSSQKSANYYADKSKICK